jgi:hypothetical protein
MDVDVSNVLYNTNRHLFCSTPNGIQTHAFDALQYQYVNIMSNAIDHSAISALYI